MSSNLKYNCIFGGGGIRGLCHIGALKALNDLDIKIGAVAGSSVGAVFAGLHTVGYTTEELRELFYKTIRAISNALDTKDSYTNGHSLRVTLYSMILAKELNLEEDYMEDIEIAGLLHDIGKIAMPKSILCKNGRLTDEEFLVMKSHPVRGEKIVINIKKLQMISEWVKSHHEKWDGTGYPDGLAGTGIPLAGRIIALADTYDAMTSTRPYRTALAHEVAIAEIARCAGTQFDPELAKKFVSIEAKINAARLAPEVEYPK